MPAEMLEKSAEHNDLKRMLLADIAIQNITAVPPVKAGSCNVYEVCSGWEIEALQNKQSVTVVTNMADFSQALSDKATEPNILIPEEAAIPQDMAKDICRREGQGQTIFIEVAENE